MTSEASKVLSRLQARCSRKECCTDEIRRKALEALGGDSAAAEEVLQSLLDDGFVNDGRYAAAFCRDKALLDGWGPVKIRHALAVKGISREVADRALDEVDPEAARRRLEKLLEARARTLQGDPQARLKLIKYALSRGYDYSQIQDCV